MAITKGSMSEGKSVKGGRERRTDVHVPFFFFGTYYTFFLRKYGSASGNLVVVQA